MPNDISKLDLLAIGDVSIDLFMAVEGGGVTEIADPVSPKICFIHGSKIPVKTLKQNVAGNAANVAAGATLLGLSTAIYAEIGDDENGARVIKELNSLNIDTTFIKKNEGAQTGIHPIIMFGDERTIFSHHEIRNYKLQNWPKPKWIYYTSVSPGFENFQTELVEYLGKNPDVGIAFSPGTYHMKAGLEGLKNILKVTHVLFLNKDEASVLVGKDTIENLHKKLQEQGPKVTVITDGANGASVSDGTSHFEIKALSPSKPILDRTGAGDAFASGALSALFYNKPLQEVLVWGILNSSAVLTEIGAIHGLKTKDLMENDARAMLTS